MAFQRGSLALPILVLTFCSALRPGLSSKQVLVLGFDEGDIHFDVNKFKGFYRCLCDSSISTCIVTTNLLHGNYTDIDNVHPGNPDFCSGIRQCTIDKDKLSNITFYTMYCKCSCEVSVCQQRITLLAGPHGSLITCDSPFVEISWVNKDFNITIKQFDERTVKVENCHPRNDAESKRLTLNCTEDTPQTTTAVSQSELDSNIKFVIFSSIFSSILIIIILVAIAIYITKVKTNLLFSEKENNVRATEDVIYQNMTLQICNLSTTRKKTKCCDSDDSSFDKKFFSFQATTQSKRKHLLNAKYLIDKGQHHTARSYPSDLMSPGHFDEMLDVSSGSPCIFDESNGLAIQSRDITPLAPARITAKCQKSGIKVPPPRLDDQGYTIVDIADTHPCGTTFNIRDVSRELKNSQEQNREGLTINTGKYLTDRKFGRNRFERALPDTPDLKDQIYESDKCGDPLTFLWDGYEVPIISIGLGSRTDIKGKEYEINGLSKTCSTLPGSLNDGYEVPEISSCSLSNLKNSQSDIAYLDALRSPKVKKCYRKSQVRRDECSMACDDVTREDLTEANKKDEERSDGNQCASVRCNNRSASEVEQFSKLRISVRKRTDNYQKCSPANLKQEDNENQTESKCEIQSSTQRSLLQETELVGSSGSSKNKTEPDVPMVDLTEDPLNKSLAHQNVRHDHSTHFGQIEEEKASERRKNCAQKYYILELVDD